MDITAKLELIKQVGEEILTEEELTTVLSLLDRYTLPRGL